MLSLFEPGTSTVPWLGDLKKLGPSSEYNGSQSAEKPDETFFPLAASSQRSYRSQSNAVWIKASGLQVLLLIPFLRIICLFSNIHGIYDGCFYVT